MLSKVSTGSEGRKMLAAVFGRSKAARLEVGQVAASSHVDQLAARRLGRQHHGDAAVDAMPPPQQLPDLRPTAPLAPFPMCAGAANTLDATPNLLKRRARGCKAKNVGANPYLDCYRLVNVIYGSCGSCR